MKWEAHLRMGFSTHYCLIVAKQISWIDSPAIWFVPDDASGTRCDLTLIDDGWCDVGYALFWHIAGLWFLF
ncbi:MAG: hypothetical protein KDE56_16245, partial [Anaerolineales bacterium]|nr:hypothetical protein [Anaerolineales bacterium]